MVLKRSYTPMEERMLGEYVAEFMGGRPHDVHLRVGTPASIDRSKPGWQLSRRYLLSTLPEADLVYRDGEDVVICEFSVWRPQTKLGQLLLYRSLLPDTPGYLDTPQDRIRLKIVVGRPEPRISDVAGLNDVEVELYSPAWLRAALARRAGGRRRRS